MGALRVVAGEGEWLLLAEWPALVLVPAAVPPDLATRIRSALDGAPAIESIVSAVPVRGAEAVASFAVLRFEEPGDARIQRVTGVVRGAAAADLLSIGGARRFGSRGAEPWALAEFTDVVGVTLGELPPVPESAPHLTADARPLESGAVHVSRVLWVADPERLLSNPAAAAGESQPHHDHDQYDDDTVVRAPAPESAPATVPDDAPVPDAPPAPDAAAAPTYSLRLNGAAPVELTGSLVIGRRPRERRAPTALPQHLLTVESPTQKVSSNHVEIALSGRTVVITDLRSTNGTVVRPQGSAPVRLRQGDSFVASGSAIVEIGDGNVIHISSRDRGKTGITA
ncbi:FHA domain-containing protein [Herbiconiux sp.]|uniref:FHA domain-containing protein n=1 Tax=Herbiconiux sp. TaxID=1871186 RepID=UPI0025BE4D8F|nr:FHA domain-containing protein [Herbiconiux sp.]